MTKANLYLNLPGINQVEFVDSRYLLPPIGQINVLYVVENDELNGRKPTIYYFNGAEYVMIGSGSGSGGMQDYQQVTKLGVIASPTTPRTYDIVITYTTNFLRAPVEVLRLTAGAQDVVKTEVGFDNSDGSDFESSDYILFDGALKLKTDYSSGVVKDETWVEEGTLLRKTIDTISFKCIEKVGV
ncbi:hypothetical protein [Bacillus sp. FJAT-52991]|uniref:Virion structural protein n=1 Tax=Bacillus kandeliae TaxID=3129297 RepID=A0ABZ2N2A3_9BACI